jgi:hypothetical protein
MKKQAEQELAEEQIQKEKEPVSYDTREYPVEVLIDKFNNNEFIIPSYQRDFVWKKSKVKMSKFIESIILDLPIPYLFFADDNDSGKLEIIDGSQRIRTLQAFRANEFSLSGLEVLDLLNGFKFEDLTESRQRRFLRKTLRSIELTEKASADVRMDLFSRINSKPYDLLPMEIRKGVFQGKFYDFINRCSSKELFVKLCPITGERRKQGEAQELVLRYFAYSDNYQKFEHRVDDFLDSYMKDKHDNGFSEETMEKQFDDMLTFVNTYFPYGFKKSPSFNFVPRVRFEAISVGVTLALRAKPNLVPNSVEDWLNSDEFKNQTTSDAANNRLKVVGRIEYVKNILLS